MNQQVKREKKQSSNNEDLSVSIISVQNVLNPFRGHLYIVVDARLMVDAASKSSTCDADQSESAILEQVQTTAAIT